MHRFYCPHLTREAGGAKLSDVEARKAAAVLLPEVEARHALRVLRLRDGEEVEVFDGRGCVGRGTLEVAAGSRDARVRLAAMQVVERSGPAVVIASALPKGSRVDGMVEQLSQLGVDVLIPLRTRFSVVDPRKQKLERLWQIAVESAKQCGRAWVMRIGESGALSELLAEGRRSEKVEEGKGLGQGGPVEGELRLMADKEGPVLGEGAFREKSSEKGRIWVLIGPEGGWEGGEKAIAVSKGFKLWRLNENILRIETAAVAAAAMVRGRTMKNSE